jgi:hypothetical protein
MTRRGGGDRAGHGLGESLISYCAQVRQRLKTFAEREKRLALESYDWPFMGKMQA